MWFVINNCELYFKQKFVEKGLGGWRLVFMWLLVLQVHLLGSLQFPFSFGRFSLTIRKTSLKPKSVYVAMVMIGITVCGYLGNAIMPFGAFLQIGVAVMSAAVPGFEMNYLAYSLMDIIICIIMCPAITLFFKLICPKFDYEILRISLMLLI